MPIRSVLKSKVKWVKSKITKILVDDRAVLTERGERYEGDYLVIASGGQNKSLFNLKGYHTLDDGRIIREIIKNPKGKNFVIGSMPGIIKCPAAPWEISFLLKNKYP